MEHVEDLPIVAEDTHARVGGTQVNTNSGSHVDWNVWNVEGKGKWVSIRNNYAFEKLKSAIVEECRDFECVDVEDLLSE